MIIWIIISIIVGILFGAGVIYLLLRGRYVDIKQHLVSLLRNISPSTIPGNDIITLCIQINNYVTSISNLESPPKEKLDVLKQRMFIPTINISDNEATIVDTKVKKSVKDIKSIANKLEKIKDTSNE
jgi:hypothetical protein